MIIKDYRVEFLTALAEQGGVAIENARELDDLWQWFSDMAHPPRY